MKLTKKLTIFLASLFLCMGLFIATGTTSQAASSIPSKARVYPKNISDVTFTLPKYNMEVRNVKSNNKNMIAKYTYGYSYKNSSEERGNATISVYTKKEGSYKLSFDLYLNGKKKSSHTITIYSKSDSPIKKITFNGKPWYEAKTSYTNAKSGTVKVVLNKGYKLKKLEVETSKVVKDSNSTSYHTESVIKSFKNGSKITLNTVPDKSFNEYGNTETGYYNRYYNNYMAAYTRINITYLDKYSKEEITTTYLISKLVK